MVICQRGTRLSITPVEPLHFKRACKLGGAGQIASLSR
jgi:predicted RNA-binding protein with PUA-like domain